MAESKKSVKPTGQKDKPVKKPSPAGNKDAPKKSAPKKPRMKFTAAQKRKFHKEAQDAAPEKALTAQEKSIAMRTVAWKSGRYFDILRWLILIPLLMMIVFFSFFMAGYSFTVLVCWCLIGIILFYNCTHLLRSRFPKTIKVVRRIFTVILCIGLLVVGITECIIIRASFGQPKETCDYVVVLGAKVRSDGPSVSLMDRIRAAHAYSEEHPDAILIVSGGKGADEPMTEAQCMYQELTALGIPESRIWVEDRATSTWENLQFSMALIEEKTGARPERIGILSSEYHLYRASLFADACGVESIGIPARTSHLSQRINHFMREVAGVWHYLLLGGQYDA